MLLSGGMLSGVTPARLARLPLLTLGVTTFLGFVKTGLKIRLPWIRSCIMPKPPRRIVLLSPVSA